MITEIEDPAAALISYEGTLTKPLLSMTPNERESYYQLALVSVRERLFAIGQPLVYKKDGEIVAEYANGHIEIIR